MLEEIENEAVFPHPQAIAGSPDLTFLEETGGLRTLQ
jgi:hypothetical protein